MSLGSTHHSPDSSIAAHEGANINQTHFTEHSKLLPWLMFISILGGMALGLSLATMANQSQSESRMRADLDRQYRFIQEVRIRAEEAEIAARQVNPNYVFPHQPKEH